MSPKRKEADLSTYRGKLGKRLRKRRDELGMKAEEVVKRINKFGGHVDISSYYGWESGRRKVDWDCVPAMVKAFKVKTIYELIPSK